MAAESKIEKYLCREVKRGGGETRKVKWINHRGAPDRLVWMPKWIFAILAELKAPGEELEAHQVREHIRLQKMGFRTCKIDSIAGVDWLLKHGIRGE